MATSTIMLGEVAVDSGMLRIIDPCYDPDENYDTRLAHNRFPDYDKRATGVSVKPLGLELGLDVGSFGGDGVYAVSAIVDDDTGWIKTVTIHLND